MLLKNGPPMEAATIVRYHPETNENIYTFKPVEPKQEFVPPKKVTIPQSDEYEV